MPSASKRSAGRSSTRSPAVAEAALLLLVRNALLLEEAQHLVRVVAEHVQDTAENSSA
jgi:hypothetical protein